MAMKRRTKPMKSRRKKPAKVRVKKVKLAPTDVVCIEADRGVTPVLVFDPAKRRVEIAPAKKKKEGWWEQWFGDY